MMASRVRLMAGISVIALSACSTQPIQQKSMDQVKQTAPLEPESAAASAWSNSGITPPLKITKGKKTLRLVKIMDGGACKNQTEGAKGEFLVYADPNDIERIKHEKNPEVFKDFENKIEAFSSQVLQAAIEATNLSENPFTLGQDEAQQKLASQLTRNFQNAVKPAVNAFQKETTLTIDIAPFSPSFVFYQKGCNMNNINPES